jgi:hypothetical protein
MKTEALNLGKLLVKELGLESSVDTISRWIAHYIAQQMIEAENTDGDEKQKVEERCFNSILKLWEHRAYYEDKKKPFESFIPIFSLLEKLCPDNEEPFFFRANKPVRDKLEDKMNESVKHLLSLASGIDSTARIWLEYVFQQAAFYATDDRVIEWIEAALPFSNDDDEIALIERLLLINEESNDDATICEKKRIEQVDYRIEQLKGYRKFNEELIAMYEEEVNRLTSGDVTS